MLNKVKSRFLSGKKLILSEIETKLKEIFKEKLVKIILYGSYARNEQKKWSDMDIMVLVDEEDKSNIKEFEDLVSEAGYYLLTKYIKDVSIIIENFNDYKEYTEYIPFYENIEKEGIIIYG